MVSALGGLTVGLCHYLTVLITVDTVVLQLAVPQWPIIVLGGIGGLFGSTVDSILGATLQYSGETLLRCRHFFCLLLKFTIRFSISGVNEQGMVVEHPGKGVKHVCGRQVLDNHSVNLLSSVITALTLPGIAKLFWL